MHGNCLFVVVAGSAERGTECSSGGQGSRGGRRACRVARLSRLRELVQVGRQGKGPGKKRSRLSTQTQMGKKGRAGRREKWSLVLKQDSEMAHGIREDRKSTARVMFGLSGWDVGGVTRFCVGWREGTCLSSGQRRQGRRYKSTHTKAETAPLSKRRRARATRQSHLNFSRCPLRRCRLQTCSRHSVSRRHSTHQSSSQAPCIA